jgi:hypothetical protein
MDPHPSMVVYIHRPMIPFFAAPVSVALGLAWKKAVAIFDINAACDATCAEEALYTIRLGPMAGDIWSHGNQQLLLFSKESASTAALAASSSWSPSSTSNFLIFSLKTYVEDKYLVAFSANIPESRVFKSSYSSQLYLETMVPSKEEPMVIRGSVRKLVHRCNPSIFSDIVHPTTASLTGFIPGSLGDPPKKTSPRVKAKGLRTRLTQKGWDQTHTLRHVTVQQNAS